MLLPVEPKKPLMGWVSSFLAHACCRYKADLYIFFERGALLVGNEQEMMCENSFE